MILPKPTSGEGEREGEGERRREGANEAISWSVREGRPSVRRTTPGRTDGQTESNEFQSGPFRPSASVCPLLVLLHLISADVVAHNHDDDVRPSLSLSVCPSVLWPQSSRPDFTLRVRSFIIPLKGIGTAARTTPLLYIGILKFLADKLANFEVAGCQFRSGFVRHIHGKELRAKGSLSLSFTSLTDCECGTLNRMRR